MLWHFHASDGRLLPPIILDRFIVQHTAAAIPRPFRQEDLRTALVWRRSRFAAKGLLSVL
uniref:Uncharacterized protein n=1 Tax=Physcomitrium patens TaxID=3218 RepID=A0A2K1IES1_PHYPA|nr:hypothetical protein PHYPA_029926 [Physcomitrium patens]